MMMSELALVLFAALLPAMKEVQHRCPTPEGGMAYQAAPCESVAQPSGATRPLPAWALRRAAAAAEGSDATGRPEPQPAAAHSVKPMR